MEALSGPMPISRFTGMRVWRPPLDLDQPSDVLASFSIWRYLVAGGNGHLFIDELSVVQFDVYRGGGRLRSTA